MPNETLSRLSEPRVVALVWSVGRPTKFDSPKFTRARQRRR